MTEVQATVSSKGQVVIAKEIRDKLGIRKNQRVVERIEGGKIVITPLKRLSELGGSLKGKIKTPVKELMREIKEGWE